MVFRLFGLVCYVGVLWILGGLSTYSRVVSEADAKGDARFVMESSLGYASTRPVSWENPDVLT